MLRAYLIACIAALLLLAFPFIRKEFKVLDSNTRAFKSLLSYKIKLEDKLSLSDSSILEDTMIVNSLDSFYFDSLAKAQLADSLENLSEQGLVNFFKALSDLEAEKRRLIKILWFGDSMIEGDMITQDVRDSLQKLYGGKGIGYMPITSVVNFFRNTIRHEFSENWYHYNIVYNEEKPSFPLSWNGEYFTAPHDSVAELQDYSELSVSYKSSAAYPGVKYLPSPTLLYSNRILDTLCPDTANYVIYNEDTLELSANNVVNTMSLASGNNYNLDLQFLMKPDQAIYGLHFHNSRGVELSNIASRGNSGMILTGIRHSIFRGMCVNQDPNLIILQFGVNASTLGVTKYDWYERSMKRVVSYLQSLFPASSILVISMSDRNVNIDGEMKTDSSVFAMNQVLQNVALGSGCGFFNLFEAMGGENSMESWVEADPPLANKDYTHFSSRGSKKVAKLFMDYIFDKYKEYKSDTIIQNPKLQ